MSKQNTHRFFFKSIGAEILRIDKLRHTTAILLNIPYGKIYFLNNHPQNQVPQKGNTCWYYVFNFLRPRFGKTAPSSSREREIEKIFSDYRKILTKIDALVAKTKAFLAFKKATPINKQNISQMLNDYKKSSRDKMNEMDGFFNQFQRQDQYSLLQDFLDNTTNQILIDACEETLSKLNDDPNAALGDFLMSHHLPTQDQLSLSVKSIHFLNLLTLKACQFYGLKISDWHPTQGILSLIDHLQKYGPMHISGLLGIPAYQDESVPLAETFGKRKIYAWYRKDYLDSAAGQHAVLIVGAEIKKGEQYVYFLDPNDGNYLNDKGKLYRMSYYRLLHGISTLYGYHLDGKDASALDGPFAIQAKDWHHLRSFGITHANSAIIHKQKDPVILATPAKNI